MMSTPARPPSAEVSTAPVQDDTFQGFRILLVLVRRRRLILLTTSIAAVLILTYNILAMTVINPWSSWNVLPSWFQAQVTLMLTDDKQSARGDGMLSNLPQGLELDGAEFLPAAKNNLTALAARLLKGPDLLDAIAKQQGLITEMSDNKEVFRARQWLRKALLAKEIFNTDLLELSYEQFYPEKAKSGLAFVTDHLRDRLHQLNIERVRERRIFLEERIADVKRGRQIAQNALIAFQQETGIINPIDQSRVDARTLSYLKTELYQKEAEILSQSQMLGSASPSVERLRSEAAKLGTIIREMGYGFVELTEYSPPLVELPSLGTRYLNLVTDVNTHDAIYSILRNQYENARLEENSKESAFQIVEPIQMPLHKSRPSRALICIYGTLVAFLASILAAFTTERFAHAKSDPAQRRNLEELRGEIDAMTKRVGKS